MNLLRLIMNNQIEKDILNFWESNSIFSKSVQQRNSCKPFVLYEGPPTANGMPGIHHVLTRTYKDMIARFWTLNNRLVERKAGWDEHGLPVEIEVQKLHGLNTKQDIATFGIDKFNAECAKSTQKYITEWEELTRRMGYWVDFNKAYRTSDPIYINKVWEVFEQLMKKGLVYKDYKVVPWAWDSETVVSNAEVAQGYKEVTDKSAYVKFKLENSNTFFLAWTTTPWTLPANCALAVKKDLTYYQCEVGEENFISIMELGPVIKTYTGEELSKMKYHRLFDGNDHLIEELLPIYCADFVKADKTGIVHIAPAFGKDDFDLINKQDVEIICHINSDGRFNHQAPTFLQGKKVAGKTFTTSNDLVIKFLQDQNRIWKIEPYTHQYPHNWRTGLPLIYYLRPSYYVATNKIRPDMIAANQNVNWFPSHIKNGRFGTWLEGNVDWAVSRERFWGTPLPIYYDQDCNYYFDKPQAPHKPEADNNNRDESVLDCWFDSGSMPFAAYNSYQQADVICEAIDQTRGWFYTLMVLGTALQNEAPYKNVVCLGHVLDKDGHKMSKSKGNTIDPLQMFEKYGADAVRWYMTRNPVGNNLVFSETDIKNVVQGFTNRLWNTYVFYTTYRDIEKWVPDGFLGKLNKIDKWIITLLNNLSNETNEHFQNYEFWKVCEKVETFVDLLSNVWVRVNRERFWNTSGDFDNNAFMTLQYVLENLCIIISPIMPFMAEHIWRDITKNAFNRKESVHLTNYPTPWKYLDNQSFIPDMEVALKAIQAGRTLRTSLGLKIRQPLASFSTKFKVENEEFVDIIKFELNVKEILTGDSEANFDTTLTDELIGEGIARDFARIVQEKRKSLGFIVTDRITLTSDIRNSELKRHLEKHKDDLIEKCLIVNWKESDIGVHSHKIDGKEFGLVLEKLNGL